MNPWIIIGWIFLSTIGLLVLLVTLKVVISTTINIKRSFYQYRMHVKTRDQSPEVGQVWKSASVTYIIQQSYVEGKLSVDTVGKRCSTHYTPEEWTNLVRVNKLRLASYNVR